MPKQKKTDSERLRVEDKRNLDDQAGRPMPLEDLRGRFVWVDPGCNSEDVRLRAAALGLKVADARAAAKVLNFEFNLCSNFEIN